MHTIGNCHVNKFIVFTLGLSLQSHCFVCFDALVDCGDKQIAWLYQVLYNNI